jgi:hypothetical protein
MASNPNRTGDHVAERRRPNPFSSVSRRGGGPRLRCSIFVLFPDPANVTLLGGPG